MTTAPRPVPQLLLGLDKIPRIEPTHNKISVLLKGVSGSGKSYLAHSFPGPVFSIYTDPNRRTITDLMNQGSVIDARRVTDWKQFSQHIVPAVVNRQLQAETIVVDTLDFLFEQLLKDLKGTRSGLTQQDWGTVLDRASEATLSLVSSTQPTPTHPGYNIVFTCHTKKITDDAGNVTDIAPSLKGQFRDAVEAFFDVVLICESDVKTTPQKDRPATRRRIYNLYSIPTSRAESAKATARWPEVITIEAGQNGYDLLKEFWNPTPTQVVGAQTTPATSTSTTAQSGPQE